MKAAPIGQDELDRLEALYRYRLLDTGADQAYDDITALAAQICGTPIALVSLVDTQRQWFKSRVGLDVAQTPRDISFCGHAIHGREVFEVSDAREDERFADNPFVTQEPNIRFYAGAPLVTPDGYAVGTLCVIDSVPHKLSDAQRSALTALGRQVVQQMELRLRLGREQRLSRKIARQAQFQQVLLDNDMAAIIATAPDGLITSFNAAAERLLGYRADDLINKEKVSLLHVKEELQVRARELSVELGREVPTREAIVAKPLAGMPEMREWHYRRRDGSLFPVMLSVSVLRDERETVSGYLALAWDLTERQEAEQALRASEGQLRMAMSAARMSLWDVDLSAQRITLDARWNELAGYEPKEVSVSFERMLALMLPHEADVVRARMLAAVRGEQPEYFAQHRVRHRDGHWFWVESRGQVVQWDPAGRAARMIGISMDITQRIAADEALRSSSERLQLAMSAARTSLWDAYPETGRVVLDARWADLIGVESREMETTFEKLAALMPPEEVSGVLAKMLAVLKGGKTDYVAEHRVRHRQGYWIWIESRGRVVERDAQGRAIRMIGTNTDITERRQAEQLKSEFVSTVSHELRTPLTSIGGALGLVCAGALGPVGEQAKSMLDIAYKNSQRLTHLINDLLDMEKLAAGKMRFDMQEQALMPLMEQAMEGTRAYADQYRVRLVLTGRAEGVRVRVDAGRLQQVLSNYLSNAAKFSPAGAQVQVRARVGAEVPEGWVRVEVQDHGAGGPLEFRERIFHMFSLAVASHTRKTGGRGLGLAISKELMERMHGRVGYESQPGAGACFWFELPLPGVWQPDAGGAA